jgi:SAM-dependent methyltransferase
LTNPLLIFIPNSFSGHKMQLTENGLDPLAMDNHHGSVPMTYWERAAASRWGRYLSRIEERVILQASFLAGHPSQALEVGCEGGRWSRMLTDNGWQMTCIDVNPKTLAACQQKVPAARTVLTSSQDETIPCEPDSMNLLLCVEVAPVINSQWFLSDAKRVLRENGILLCVCWNRASLRGIVSRFKERLAPTSGTVFYRRSYSDWRKDLNRVGFEPIHEEGFCWAFFGRMSNSPFIPLFTKLERLLHLHSLTRFSPWVIVIARKSSNNQKA